MTIVTQRCHSRCHSENVRLSHLRGEFVKKIAGLADDGS